MAKEMVAVPTVVMVVAVVEVVAAAAVVVTTILTMKIIVAAAIMLAVSGGCGLCRKIGQAVRAENDRNNVLRSPPNFHGTGTT